MCVNATDPGTYPNVPHFSEDGWEDAVMFTATKAGPVEAPTSALGWPVGTLVTNRRNGRRGIIRWSKKNRCSIEFSDGPKNVWVTTWDVVLANYAPVQ